MTSVLMLVGYRSMYRLDRLDASAPRASLHRSLRQGEVCPTRP